MAGSPFYSRHTCQIILHLKLMQCYTSVIFQYTQGKRLCYLVQLTWEIQRFLRLLKLGIEIAHILFLSNNFEVTSFTCTSLPSGLARMKLRGSLFKLRKGFWAKAELPAVRAPRTRAGPDCVGFSPPHLLSGESWTPAPFLKESATFFSQ